VRIIGVVRDVRHGGPAEDFGAAVYAPMFQRQPAGRMHVVVKAANDPRNLTASVRAAAKRVNASVPIYAVRQFEDIREEYVRDHRFMMTVMSWFGWLAFALSMAGLYGVISYLMHLRTPELGVRMALGASSRSIAWNVLGEGCKHAITGILLGVLAAVGLSRYFGSAIERFGAMDMSVLGGVAALTAAVAVVATWLPARRAARVDPLVALRHE
jgi:ABC-type lipoprotein release transport system permease subunit